MSKAATNAVTPSPETKPLTFDTLRAIRQQLLELGYEATFSKNVLDQVITDKFGWTPDPNFVPVNIETGTKAGVVGAYTTGLPSEKFPFFWKLCNDLNVKLPGTEPTPEGLSADFDVKYPESLIEALRKEVAVDPAEPQTESSVRYICTGLDVGNEVFFLHNNEINLGVVRESVVTIGNRDEDPNETPISPQVKTEYFVAWYDEEGDTIVRSFNEDKVFSSRENLINSL